VSKKHKPRSGSLAFYPRKRASSQKPRINSVKRGEEAKPLNFYAYKAGMTHVVSTDQHQKSASYGQKVMMAATVLECPAIKVLGYRAYMRDPKGLFALTEVWVKELPKQLSRTLKGAGAKKSKKADEKKTEEKPVSKKNCAEMIKERLADVSEIRLIGCTQPWLTGIGKKKPELVEIFLGGPADKQFEFAQQFLGKELLAKDVFDANEFIDVVAITKGKGFQGVVKRAGVKLQTRKGKKARVVGSIGPWHPANVMFTVARPGQMGYHTRTEYNKKILEFGSDKEISPSAGFRHYGVVKNDYVILEGSVPGPAKRCIGLRKGIRLAPTEKHKLEGVEFIASKQY